MVDSVRKMLALALRRSRIRLRMNTSLSDNQVYPPICCQASNDYRVFNEFRRNPIYNSILEHVTGKQGGEYLSVIAEDVQVLARMGEFKRNDLYGNPRTQEYEHIGAISPTTLRYIKVLVDCKKHFGTLDNRRICEIGVGYGGQCRIINAYWKPASYCLVDLYPALELARRYLDNYILPSVLCYRTMNELSMVEDYDVAISNYAFTELPRAFQDVYLQNVMLRSKRGYITYNEITPEGFRSYKAGELQELIPGARILKEVPLTSPKNCIIVW